MNASSPYHDLDAARRALSDPALPATDLASIAALHPQLRPMVAKHPGVYPNLLDWLRRYGHHGSVAAPGQADQPGISATRSIADETTQRAPWAVSPGPIPSPGPAMATWHARAGQRFDGHQQGKPAPRRWPLAVALTAVALALGIAIGVLVPHFLGDDDVAIAIPDDAVSGAPATPIPQSSPITDSTGGTGPATAPAPLPSLSASPAASPTHAPSSAPSLSESPAANPSTTGEPGSGTSLTDEVYCGTSARVVATAETDRFHVAICDDAASGLVYLGTAKSSGNSIELAASADGSGYTAENNGTVYRIDAHQLVVTDSSGVIVDEAVMMWQSW